MWTGKRRWGGWGGGATNQPTKQTSGDGITNTHVFDFSQKHKTCWPRNDDTFSRCLQSARTRAAGGNYSCNRIYPGFMAIASCSHFESTRTEPRSTPKHSRACRTLRQGRAKAKQTALLSPWMYQKRVDAMAICKDLLHNVTRIGTTQILSPSAAATQSNTHFKHSVKYNSQVMGIQQSILKRFTCVIPRSIILIRQNPNSQNGGYDHEKLLALRPRHPRLQLLPKRQPVPFPLAKLVRRTLSPVKKVERYLGKPHEERVKRAQRGSWLQRGCLQERPNVDEGHLVCRRENGTTMNLLASLCDRAQTRVSLQNNEPRVAYRTSTSTT